MEPILAADAVRALEARHARATPTLMERAGRAVAAAARRLAADTGAPLLVLAGPGNNGGDAWVAAALLREAFHRVVVLDATGGAPKLAAAQAAKAAFLARGGEVVRAWPEALAPALVIDGLLGIGLARDVEEPFASLIAHTRSVRAPILAIDVPSGLDADTGRVRGDAVRASHTLTFLARKPGLHTGAGPALCGEVTVDDLGAGADARREARGALLTPEAVRGWLAPRRADAHKGDFGTVGIVGGQKGMVGAALLAGRAALLAGTGKVMVGLLAADAPGVDTAYPELMLRPVDDALAADVLVVGPGAGQSPSATSVSMFERTVLPAAIATPRPLVLDADALNVLSHNDALRTESVPGRGAATVVTPHPGEAARLLGIGSAEVQADRVAAACRLAASLRAHVVLKGAGSVCAFPDGRWSINATGNPGLASGGTGDVLAGVVGALLAQGLAAERALQYGVCLHGAAADSLVARGRGPVGLTASEVALECRRLLNLWTLRSL